MTTEDTSHPIGQELTEEDRKRFSTWFRNYVRNVNPLVGIDDAFAVFEYATKYERSKQAELEKEVQRLKELVKDNTDRLLRIIEVNESNRKLREALEAIANENYAFDSYSIYRAINRAKSALQ